MNKIVWIKKKTKWFLLHILSIIIGNICNVFIKRDKKYWLFNAKRLNSIDYFEQNTKYLYLYLKSIPNLNIYPIWICDNKEILTELKRRGFKNVYSQKSIKGIYYALKSKYWFYDWQVLGLTIMFAHKACLINLWHGIPLKKIEYDMENFYYHKYNVFLKFLFDIFSLKSNYYIVNGNYDKKCFLTAFKAKDSQLLKLGSPRTDILFNNITNSDILMNQDIEYLKNQKTSNKKIFVYMPTFRDTGKNIFGWLKSKELTRILKENNSILVCKLHPMDQNNIVFDTDKYFYIMNSSSDIYAILKYSDVLITDYSSVYFDYLLLDKPILYYSPDLDEYQEKCRGFYEPYDKLTAGVITQTEEELLSAMQNVIDRVDNYKEQRKTLRDRMFQYQDGRNCERVVEWIKNLDK